jgi:host factor-I protein
VAERQDAGAAAVYNRAMSLTNATQPRKNTPQIDTGQEGLYLKSLSERQVPVAVKMMDGEVVTGWIEYFDETMIRLTREGKPNLFIYKQQIRTITEHKSAGPKRSGNRE